MLPLAVRHVDPMDGLNLRSLLQEAVKETCTPVVTACSGKDRDVGL